MIYFAMNGRLIGVKCPSAQRGADDDRYQFTTTLEGKRKAQVLPGNRRRVWDLTLGDVTTPEQVSVLLDIARGAWGKGPFWFVPAEAPNTNMFEPGVASCDPLAGSGGANRPGGPMRTVDGWFARSWQMNSGAGTVHFGGGYHSAAPVRPGDWVTAASYVEGAGAATQLVFLDAAGTFVDTITSPVTGAATGVVRSHLTVQAPVGAVAGFVRAVNAVRAAAPSLTWTDRVVPFTDGRGASQVAVDQVSSDLVYTQPGRTFQNLSFTVTEVG